jgi:hypothetical protein
MFVMIVLISKLLMELLPHLEQLKLLSVLELHQEPLELLYKLDLNVLLVM